MRGTISIDENRCKGCGLCVPVCPKGIIRISTHFTPRGYRSAQLVDPILIDPHHDCTGCLLCATICPEAAITVYREAAKRKDAVPA
jgi:2-oxoglutarate ferredoxin oxidoreductase subunit delta